MQESKAKLFIENIFIYGIGGVISKVIPLIMVPIITRLMPDSSTYGISDLSNTVISFGSAFAVMGMYDAMYRMFFEKDDVEYKKDICSTALTITMTTSIIVAVLMVTFKELIAQYAFGSEEYDYLVYVTAIATLVSATNNIVSAPTRMQNDRKTYLLMNTLSPVLSYSVSIPLLLRGHYILALPVAAAIAGATSEMIFLFLNRRWFCIRRFRKEYVRPLLKIALPLFPNFLIYWLFNSSDKLMIVNLIGTSASGIYSVGAKLGHASNLIYLAFAGGWQFFAFSTMNDKDQVKNNSMIFEYLGVISFVATMFICALSYPIFKLLFVGEYVSGYIIAPYLFLAPLLQMLFQTAGNQFLVIKKTWPNLFILSFGAVLNIGLNLALIPAIGIEGAAIATLLGYTASVVVCVAVLCKMKLHIISARFVFTAVLLVLYMTIWRFVTLNYVALNVLMALLFTVCMVFVYRKDIIRLITGLKNSRVEGS